MALLTLAVVGRLAIWLAQISGPTRWLWQRHPMLGEFGSCDLCLGVWIYSLLAWPLHVNLLEPVYVPGLSEAATGIVMAAVAHLARLGWQAKWGTVTLEG